MIYQSLMRLLGSFLSARGGSEKLLILTYHRVLISPDPLLRSEPDVVEFEWQIKMISEIFNVISLEEAVLGLRNGSLPSRAVCITFDDGYADNYHLALPILKKHKVPAIFFIATGYLNDGIMWNDIVIESFRNHQSDYLELTPLGLGGFPLNTVEEKRNSIKKILEKLKYLSPEDRISKVNQIAEHGELTVPRNLMMRDAEVRKMFDAGMAIGAHTVNHPILAKISDQQARKEIVEGKEKLESIIANKVNIFAYPNGKFQQDYLQNHVEILKQEKFHASVTTEWGYSNQNVDFYQMPRIMPWDNTALRFALRMLKTYLE